MTLQNKIEAAYRDRTIPEKIVAFGGTITSEQKGAIWFNGRDWRSLTEKDWHDHADAIFAFTNEAFAYYLPSILSLTAGGRRKLAAADAIVQSLDRSPTIPYWDEFLTTRFLGLKDEEYEALNEWLLSLSGHSDVEMEDALTRAYETVDLLQKETAHRMS